MLNNVVAVTKPIFEAAYAWLVPSRIKMGIRIRISIAVRACIGT